MFGAVFFNDAMIKTVVSNGHNAYLLAAGKSLPEFIADRKSRTKRNREWTHRLELIQDFDFPLASCKCNLCATILVARIRVSQDGCYLAATGTYPPKLKIYDTEQLSMKHYRGLDAEVVDMQFLSKDYKKIAMLHNDRTVEFHAQGGRHCRIRIPKRDACCWFIFGADTAQPCRRKVSDTCTN